MGWVLADKPLTFVRRHQQIQSLLGQIGPNQRDLLSQLSIALVLFNTPCGKEGERRSHTTRSETRCPVSTYHHLHSKPRRRHLPRSHFLRTASPRQPWQMLQRESVTSSMTKGCEPRGPSSLQPPDPLLLLGASTSAQAHST